MLSVCYIIVKGGKEVAENQKMIRFLLENDKAEKLEREAISLGLSVSAFLRLLIKQWDDGIRFERIESHHVK